MKSLTEHMKEQLNERRVYKTLEDALEDSITSGIITAWDEAGITFTHKDIKEALEKIAKNYDVDKHIDWAKEYMK